MNKMVLGIMVPVLGLPLLAVGVGGAMDAAAPADGAPAVCQAGSTSVSSDWSDDQVANATAIVNAGADVTGVTPRDETIAVMVAIGESGLVNIAWGDWETSGVRNPDGTQTTSIGLFQQQEWWGTTAQRMDPHDTAVLFYKALVKIADRDTMEPGSVAFAVQVGGSPAYYQTFWDKASALVGAVSCGGSWVAPGSGPITSPYGTRSDPITGETVWHTGTDLANGGCGTPILAAHGGTVTTVGVDGQGNGMIIVDTVDPDHTISIRYLHMWTPGELVTVGDQVTTGQVIAHTGSSGYSTGCHLHFRVDVDGSTVDPVTFMAGHGVTLGGPSTA